LYGCTSLATISIVGTKEQFTWRTYHTMFGNSLTIDDTDTLPRKGMSSKDHEGPGWSSALKRWLYRIGICW
jgi:hypothetical protein